jgi:hypothetical protein
MRGFTNDISLNDVIAAQQDNALLPQGPRCSTARGVRIDRSAALEQNANMFKRGDPKPTGHTWRQVTLGKLMRAGLMCRSRCHDCGHQAMHSPSGSSQWAIPGSATRFTMSRSVWCAAAADRVASGSRLRRRVEAYVSIKGPGPMGSGLRDIGLTCSGRWQAARHHARPVHEPVIKNTCTVGFAPAATSFDGKRSQRRMQ